MRSGQRYSVESRLRRSSAAYKRWRKERKRRADSSAEALRKAAREKF
jgi:hypothetical protein